jgi:hypothetical protein
MFGKKYGLLLVVALAGFLSVACDRKEIGEITADPGAWSDKEVNVGGRVTQSIGVLSTGIYQIDDGTGKLWVLTNSRGVPTKGALVGVRGRVTPTVTFLGVNYATVLRETGRKSGS